VTSSRIVRACASLAVLAALAAGSAASASAKTMPQQQPLRILIVPSLSPHELAELAKRGAVGMLVPGAGPTTNRRQALSALVRGVVENARLGGVATGAVLVDASSATGFPTGHPEIILTLPPKGRPILNDRRYPIAIVGRGYHGVLISRTTRIPGLVSILDVAPTALQRPGSELLSAAQPDAARTVENLDARIAANNQLKLPSLVAILVLVGFLAIFWPAGAFPAISAALLGSLGLGFVGPTNVAVLVAAFVALTLLGGIALARICSTESRLLALLLVVLAAYGIALVVDPTAIAVNPLGPTQNSRFFGIGNQVETLLLGPVLAAAGLAGRRFGLLGFLAVGVLAFVGVAENSLGADGGGAVVFALALAVFAARLCRLSWRGILAATGVAAIAVLALMSYDQSHTGHDHMRSAFSHGFGGLLAVAHNRIPLSYVPAIHAWAYVGPFLIAFAVVAAVAIRGSSRHDRRDLVVALVVGVGASLLVNDSAAYELVAATATLVALHRTRFGFAPLRTLSIRPLPAAEGALVPNPATGDQSPTA
jgi:hypothetical protein